LSTGCGCQGWIISKRERKINVPERFIALDCEMLDCEGREAQIVKIFAVDRICDILIDELVLPDKKVVDYLTHITGGKAEDLEGVSLTQEAVQVCCQHQFTTYGLLRI
jgi:RNA exonuclease 1